MRMRSSPSIAPSTPDDVDVYLVLQPGPDRCLQHHDSEGVTFDYPIAS